MFRVKFFFRRSRIVTENHEGIGGMTLPSKTVETYTDERVYEYSTAAESLAAMKDAQNWPGCTGCEPIK